ncbi:MAG: type II toxin-antitoxin system RelE/ParE family toxin [Cyanobacteria bacterium P01_G01_bin.19]
MAWTVEFHPLFAEEYHEFSQIVQDKLLEEVLMLEEFASQLGRPIVDTLNNSKHSNMKELRFNADNGVWRTAFAFDPERKAILLVAGDKSRSSQKRFYKQLIKKADERFSEHLQKLKEKKHD